MHIGGGGFPDKVLELAREAEKMKRGHRGLVSIGTMEVEGEVLSRCFWHVQFVLVLKYLGESLVEVSWWWGGSLGWKLGEKRVKSRGAKSALFS